MPNIWTEERRERMARMGRERFGAPEGHCTIYGIHVPVEHGKPVRYWAEWLVHNAGLDVARGFVLNLKANDYAEMEAIRELWQRKMDVRENRKTLRLLEWEAYRAAKNSG